MHRLLSFLLVCLLLGSAPAWAAEKDSPKQSVELSPEDRKVVAVMEILQLMDLTEEMDMIQDINTLIEEDQNESQTD